MHRFVTALALACTLLWPAAAEARRCTHAIPVFFEGVGTLWICVRPARRG